MGFIFQSNINIQEMITSSDTRDMFVQAINAYLMDLKNSPFYDNGFEEIFGIFDTNKKTEVFPKGPKFAIVWYAVAEGEAPKFSTVSDTDDVNVNVVHWRAALNYSKDWFRYNQIPLIEKMTEEFRNSAARLLSKVHYGVITAAASTGVTADSANYDAVGDAIESQVLAMRAPVENADGTLDYTDSCFATHVLANPANAQLARKAIDPELRSKLMETDKTANPLSEFVASLKVIASDYVTAGRLLVVESKRYFVALKDGELELETEESKQFNAESTYGSQRRGASCLSTKAIRYVDIP